MLIGILSDTHDHRECFQSAIWQFRKMGVDMVLHAGDFCSPFMHLDWAENPWCDFIGVFGNNDGDKTALTKTWTERAKVVSDVEIISTDNGLLHLNHYPERAKEGLSSGRFAFVVHGHTHKWHEKRESGVLLINPGECCGWRYGNPTAALLDTMSRTVIRLDL